MDNMDLGLENGLRYGIATTQGFRSKMEDTHSIITNMPSDLGAWSFFGIFDGHNGIWASDYCAEKMIDVIARKQEFWTGLNELSRTGASEIIKNCIRDSFLQLDCELRSVLEGKGNSGTTAICCLLSPDHILLANCGDSRAVMSSSEKVSFTTLDHKPYILSEKERIENAGGTVFMKRINGSLAVSRSLGDFQFKQAMDKGPCQQLVSPEPEIFVIERDDKTDEFLVLASDGIWDVLSNEELCDFVRSELLFTDNLTTICNHVIKLCFDNYSKDNMTIIIIQLSELGEEAEKSLEECDTEKLLKE